MLKGTKLIFSILRNTKNNRKMSNPNEDRSKQADNIIRNHVIWSMGAGMIPVLVADIFAVSALQLDMIRQLCKVYDIDFQETQGKAIVTSLTSSTLARVGAGSLVKLIPGIGSLLGGVTVSGFAGASTYALGEVFKKHFNSGGTILDFDPSRLKKYYQEKFEKGKKVAKDLSDKDPTVQDEVEEIVEDTPIVAAEPKSDSEPIKSDKSDKSNGVISRLRELGDLKSSGIITQEEFDKMKKKLLDNF